MNSTFEIRHSEFSSVTPCSTIKRGERPWPDVNAWRLRLHKEFDEAFASTKLPERPDYNWANEFLLKARREMAADPNLRT